MPLKKIQELVKAGAKVAGIKPVKSPSMGDNDAEFQAIVADIWGKTQNSKLETQNFTEILRGVNISEDVIVKNNKAKILYVHRQTADQDIYWLDNRSENENDAEISFRITGKTPELWRPQTGKTEKVSYQIKDGRTTISLHFDSWEACFIVFKDNTTANSYKKPAAVESSVLTISSPWKVSFQEGRGAPQAVTFNKLFSWSEADKNAAEIRNPKPEIANTEGGIKYFSGTATYQFCPF